MARLGIIGYPNAGKTTLFNALTGLNALAAPHPYATTEPNVGVARIPDDELERAAALEGSAKIVHATLDLVDFPAMGGQPNGGGDARLLARLREQEAICVVLRAFTDPSVPAQDSGTDAVEQAENLGLELVLADAEVFARRRERLTKEASADPGKKREAESVARAAELLADGMALRTVEWSAEERGFFRDLAPLTLKPIIWVVNVDEDHAGEFSLEGSVPAGDPVVVLSAEIEEEGSRLEPAERAELFEGLGLGEGALAAMVRAAHAALDLLSFYTLGAKEAHAWTVPRGAKAREAAGKIHSDFERGFIRAEVGRLGDIVAAGGWDEAKAAGLVRLEGKDYQVRDRDVMLVRFSV